MKKLLYVFMFLYVISNIVFAGGENEAKKPIVLKFGHLANEQHSWHLAAIKFKESVEEKSNGRIEVQVYPNEQLGKEVELLNGIQAGVVDMTITGESMQNFNAPLTAMLAVPFLIKDADHLKEVIEGEPGQKIAEQIQNNLGFYPLAYFQRGARNLTSNRPVSSPEDLQGMILRVPNVPLFVNYWQAAGAKPTPMAFSEVFTGLQQGTIEGQENPLSLINSANFFEVQKYVNLTEHVISWIYVVISDKKLKSLSQDLQTIVIDAGQEMQKYENKLFQEDQKRLKQVLTDKGMTFNSVDKTQFQAIAKDVIYSSLDSEQKKLYDIISGM